MPGPNWWETEDTTPQKGGWLDFLLGDQRKFEKPPPAPDEGHGPIFSDFLGAIRRPAPTTTVVEEGPTSYAKRQLDAPSYGDMEFANADDSEFKVLQANRQEIPYIPKKKDFFEETWDSITDIAGRPLGKIVDALSWTADRTEQVFGLAYWNDVPDLQTRWEMGKLTYEMGGMPGAGWGSATKAEQAKIREELLAGRDVEELIREYEGGWTDIILKTILDPLNLIGGLPGLTRLPLVGGSKAAKLLNQGLAIPIIKLGVDPLKTMAAKALQEGIRARDAGELAQEIGHFRTATGFFRLNPYSKAAEVQNVVLKTFAGIVGNQFDPVELGLVGDALRAGTPAVLQARYGEAALGKNFARVADLFAEEGIDLREFRSLKVPVAESEEAFKAMTRRQRAGVFQNQQQQIAAFNDDLQKTVFPATERYFGVPENRSGLDKVHGWLKQALGIAYLNRPGFIMMNVLNNWFTRSFTFLDFKAPAYTAAELAERGIPLAVAQKVGADVGQFSREYLTNATDPLWKKALMLSVRVASKSDAYNREQAFGKSTATAWNWLWHFDDTVAGGIKGFLPRLPEEVRARLPRDFADNLEGRILALKNEEGITNLAGSILAGDPGLSMEKYLLRLAREQGLNPQQTRLFMEVDEPLKLRVNDILRQAGTPDEMIRGVDKIKAGLLHDVLRYRELDALPPDIKPPRPSSYERGALSESLIRQRQETRWDAWERYLRAFGVEGDAIESVKAIRVNTDAKLDALRQKAWKAQFARQEGQPVKDPWPVFRRARLALMETDQEAIARVLGNHPDVAARLRFTGDLERDAHNLVDAEMVRAWRDTGKMVEAGRSERFRQAFDFADETFIKSENDMLRYMGIERRPPAFALAGDVPQMGEAATVRYHRWGAMLDRVKEDALADMARAADPKAAALVRSEDLAAAAAYVKGLTPYMKTARVGMMDIAEKHTEFVMLNYNRKYGGDDIIKHFYPYEFWPTRTAFNWLRRSWHRPGAVGALAKLYDNYADMNRDLPERLKHQFKIPVDVITAFLDNIGIPVPGLPAWAGNDVYFDPIQIMFPMAQWSQDFADEERTQTAAGRLLNWLSTAGPGLAPWVTLPLGYSGIAGDRADWIGYQLSGGPFFLPGTRAQRGIAAFLSTGKEDPGLDEETKHRVLLGEGLPENQLREVLGLEPGDKWDEYRINRMLANMTAIKQITPQAALEAMKTGKGKVWNKARVMASQEAGLRALTGWAIGMGVSIYPEGEQIQRGIGQLRELFAKDVERTGDRSLWQVFYSAFPEYQPRQAAVASDDKRQGVLDTSLFYTNLGAVTDKYEVQLDDMERQIRALENAGGLKTKAGRENRSALKDRQSALYEAKDAEIARLREAYPKASATPSVYDPPEERALKLLRNDYYSIKDKDYTALKAKREAWLKALPATEGDFLALQREAAAVIARYRAVIKQSQDNKAPRTEITRLYEKRDEALNLLTREASKGITRADFLTFIAIEKQPPTEESQRYKEAGRLMGVYKTIAPENREMRAAFWDAHPLLDEYYGNDEPSDALYRAQAQMWNSYYALPAGRARSDWMRINADRLNQLQVALGKEPKYGLPTQSAAAVRPQPSFAATQRMAPTNPFLERAKATTLVGGR